MVQTDVKTRSRSVQKGGGNWSRFMNPSPGAEAFGITIRHLEPGVVRSGCGPREPQRKPTNGRAFTENGRKVALLRSRGPVLPGRRVRG